MNENDVEIVEVEATEEEIAEAIAEVEATFNGDDRSGE